MVTPENLDRRMKFGDADRTDILLKERETAAPR
jgi:hypothetical protein